MSMRYKKIVVTKEFSYITHTKYILNLFGAHIFSRTNTQEGERICKDVGIECVDQSWRVKGNALVVGGRKRNDLSFTLLFSHKAYYIGATRGTYIHQVIFNLEMQKNFKEFIWSLEHKDFLGPFVNFMKYNIIMATG